MRCRLVARLCTAISQACDVSRSFVFPDRPLGDVLTSLWLKFSQVAVRGACRAAAPHPNSAFSRSSLAAGSSSYGALLVRWFIVGVKFCVAIGEGDRRSFRELTLCRC